MEEVVLSPGKDVITQGEPGDYFYVVDGGEADVYVSGKHVSSIGRGGSFGELALMYNCPRAATVRAKTEITLWQLDRATFRAVLVSSSSSKRKMYEAFLSNVPVLATLTDAERSGLADLLEENTYEGGEEIVKQGDRGSSFYIVVEGSVSIRRTEETAGSAGGEMVVITPVIPPEEILLA